MVGYIKWWVWCLRQSLKNSHRDPYLAFHCCYAHLDFVAGKMTEQEKSVQIAATEPPPKYTVGSGQNTKYRRTIVALIVYSVAITTLVVALAIFGGLFYHRLLQTCDFEEETDPKLVKKHVEEKQVGANNVVKETELDYQKEIEIMRFSSPGADVDGSVIVIDYKRSLTSMYVPAADECYLIGGVDHHLTSPFKQMDVDNSADDDEQENTVEHSNATKPEENNLYYEKADDYPMMNPSLLPAPLRPYCQEKAIYWLERTTYKDTGSVRVRRGWGWVKKTVKKIWKVVKKPLCHYVTSSFGIRTQVCVIVEVIEK